MHGHVKKSFPVRIGYVCTVLLKCDIFGSGLVLPLRRFGDKDKLVQLIFIGILLGFFESRSNALAYSGRQQVANLERRQAGP